MCLWAARRVCFISSSLRHSPPFCCSPLEEAELNFVRSVFGLDFSTPRQNFLASREGPAPRWSALFVKSICRLKLPSFLLRFFVFSPAILRSVAFTSCVVRQIKRSWSLAASFVPRCRTPRVSCTMPYFP